MPQELREIIASQVFAECNLPLGRKEVIGGWISKWNTNKRGGTTRGKCQLVVWGFMQEERVDVLEPLPPLRLPLRFAY